MVDSLVYFSSSTSVKMHHLSQDQRTWICLEMARVENARQVRRSWVQEWPGVPPPSARAILYNYNKYKEHGTSHNRHKGNSGRNKTARSLENVERVRRSIQRNGNVSSRRNGLGMSRSTFNRIVHELHLHPYVLVKRQALLPNDPAERLNFCNWLVAKTNEDPGFLGNLISSDEAIFSLNSEANTKNEVQYSRYGNGHPEDHFIERAQGAGRVMVWLGLMGNGNVLGPHFVQGNLDQREYLRIVRYHVVQEDLRNQGVDRELLWWQQDGAPAHTSRAAIQYLQGQFPGKLISKRGEVPWPPRSPDLAILDFFAWGYLKQMIWGANRDRHPRNIEQLKAAIVRECAALPREMVSNAFQSLTNRARRCIAANGRHFEN